MRIYKKILVWENKKRIDLLIKFRNLVVEYFNNLDISNQENKIAEQKRREINVILVKAHSAILAAGVSTSITQYPPPAVGGYVIHINVIDSIFDFDSLYLDRKFITDIIERAIGVYLNDRINSLLRTINPFYWLYIIIDYITSLPFVILGKVGFNQKKIEGSFTGKLIKAIISLIIVFASFLTILEKLGYLDWFKNLLFKQK